MSTAKTHVGRLLVKLGARDRAQLVIAAYDADLVALKLVLRAAEPRRLQRTCCPFGWARSYGPAGSRGWAEPQQNARRTSFRPVTRPAT